MRRPSARSGFCFMISLETLSVLRPPSSTPLLKLMSHSTPIPDSTPMPNSTSMPIASPPAHVGLYQPEIPGNTGNIGRTCVAVGAKLWIVEPAAFSFDEKRLRRAGLDYWQYLDWEPVPSWDVLCEQLN